MDRETKVTDVYEPNKKVKITVTNKPKKNEDNGRTYYDRKVAINISAGVSEDRLVFETIEEFHKYLDDVDFEDPQQQLV